MSTVNSYADTELGWFSYLAVLKALFEAYKAETILLQFSQELLTFIAQCFFAPQLID